MASLTSPSASRSSPSRRLSSAVFPSSRLALGFFFFSSTSIGRIARTSGFSCGISYFYYGRRGRIDLLKKIDAIVRTGKLEEIKAALEEAGLVGMTTEPVRGHGRQQGRTELYRGSTYAINLLPKVRIEVIVPDDRLEDTLAIIVQVAQTGEIG